MTKARELIDPGALVALAGCATLLAWIPAGWSFSPALGLPLIFVLISWAPGHLLSKGLGVPRGAWWAEWAIDASLGLSVALLVATIAARAGWEIDAVPSGTAAAGLLAGLAWILRVVLRGRAGAPLADEGKPHPDTSWFAAALVAAVAVALAGVVVWQSVETSDDLPAGADMWAYLRFVNQFQTGDLTVRDPYAEGDDVVARMKYPGWLVVQAVLVRQGNLDPLGMYVRFLPPALGVLGFGTALALALEVCGGRSPNITRRRPAQTAALGVVAATALMYMTSVHLDWQGFLYMSRIGEDKVFLWFVLAPGVLALAVRWLAPGAPGERSSTQQPLAWLAALAAGVAAVAITHPLGIFQFGVVTGGFAGLELLVHRKWSTFARAAALGAIILACVAIPVTQRSELSGDRLSVSERLAAENPLDLRRVWVLSAEDGSFMSSPRLLLHPFAIAGILGALLLIPRIPKSTAARYAFAATALPALLVLTPITAPVTAKLVSVGLLWRVLWLMPFPLTTVAVFAEYGPAIQRRLRLDRPRMMRVVAPAAVSVVVSLALLPRLLDQLDSFLENKTFASPLVTDAEKKFFDRIAGIIEPGSGVMSPPGTEVPDQTYRLAAIIPDIYGLAYRSRVLDPGPAPGQGSYAALVRFFGGDVLNKGKLSTLQRYGVDYVIFLRASEALPLTERIPGLFTNVYRDPTYLVFRVDQDVVAGALASGRY